MRFLRWMKISTLAMMFVSLSAFPFISGCVVHEKEKVVEKDPHHHDTKVIERDTKVIERR